MEICGTLANLGFGGNGPLSELAALVEFGIDLKPALILWFYYPNDLQQDIFRERQEEVLSKYLTPGFRQNLPKYMEAIGQELERHFWSNFEEWKARELGNGDIDYDILEWWRSGDGQNPLNAINGLTLRRTRTALGLIEGGGDWPEPPRSLFHDVLQQVSLIASRIEGQLVFIYLPSWTETIMWDESKARYRKAALDVARELEIPVIDLRLAFAQHPDPRSLWPNRSSGHYGREGHAYVAQIVYDELEKRNFVSHPVPWTQVLSHAAGLSDIAVCHA